MTSWIGALLMVLSPSLFGSPALSALDSAPEKVSGNDGDKGKKGSKNYGKK
jgi:hypothetical protein